MVVAVAEFNICKWGSIGDRRWITGRWDTGRGVTETHRGLFIRFVYRNAILNNKCMGVHSVQRKNLRRDTYYEEGTSWWKRGWPIQGDRHNERAPTLVARQLAIADWIKNYSFTRIQQLKVYFSTGCVYLPKSLSVRRLVVEWVDGRMRVMTKSSFFVDYYFIKKSLMKDFSL